MFEEQLKRLEALDPLIQATGDKEMEVLSSFLYERISNPDSYVVFLGETSSGKSSIINGLFGKVILPVKANPSTGCITEIELSPNVQQNEYWVIYNNATIKKIDFESFRHLCETPTENVNRLRLRYKWDKGNLRNMRVFDTPGYGSIVEKHEEILKDFLPNSDVVVYVVDYRIGIQNEDFAFLMSFNELVREDVEVVLVINRCDNLQSDDRKICEITRYVNDIISRKPKVFCLPVFVPEEGQEYAMPQCPQLWEYLDMVVDSDYRKEKIREAFEGYIVDLYHKCDSIIQSRYITAKMSDDEFNEISRKQKEYADKIRQAIPLYIEPTFEKMKKSVPSQFGNAGARIVSDLEREVDIAHKNDMDDMIAFTKVHLIPYTIKHESQEIQSYLETELNDLNEKVDDYIQKERISFNNEIEICLHSNVEIAAGNLVNKLLQKGGVGTLGKYFVKFGGAGGANAGIANAASHTLKQIGDLFGKTFSKETHNALKHFLSKVGATSMKAVGAAVAVFAELLFYGIQLATWQHSLKKAIRKGVDNWKQETLPMVLEDLDKLKKVNIQTINEIAEEIESTIDSEKSNEAEQFYKEVLLSEQIAKSLNIK